MKLRDRWLRRHRFDRWRLERLAQIGQGFLELEAHLAETGHELLQLCIPPELARDLEAGLPFHGELVLARQAGEHGTDILHLVQLDVVDDAARAGLEALELGIDEDTAA